MRASALALALISSAALVACGGGGSDSGSSSSGSGTSTTSGPLALTSTNYNTAAQESVSSSNYLSSSSGLLTGAQVSTDGGPLRFAREQALKMNQWIAKVPQVAVGVSQTATVACDGGGSMTVTSNDANNSLTADAGDSTKLVANNCVTAGETVNGTLTIGVTSSTGDLTSNNFSAVMSMTLDNLTTTTSSGTSVGSGTMNMSLTATGNNSSSLTVTLSNMSMSTNYGGVSSTRTMKDYVLKVVISPSGLSFNTATTITGTLGSTALDSKTVSIQTITPFVATGTSAIPSSGQMVLTGASGSKVRVTAKPGAVLVELDADGDGTYETSNNKTWSALI